MGKYTIENNEKESDLRTAARIRELSPAVNSVVGSLGVCLQSCKLHLDAEKKFVDTFFVSTNETICLHDRLFSAYFAEKK